MGMNKLFSKSAFILLITASLTAYNGKINAESKVNTSSQSKISNNVVAQAEPTGQSEVEGAVEDEIILEEDVLEEDLPQETENVTTEEVSENFDELIGQTVTIRSDALEIVEPTSFIVGDQSFFGGEEILIINASGEIFELPEDDTEVQVTGEVVNLVLADIESEYDLGLDPDLYVDYEGKPAIIAQSLAAAPEPGEIAADPSQYYGQILAVTGEIEAIYSDNSFTLDEDQLFGGEDLLVIVTNPIVAPIEDGETVAVTGELRPFVTAEFETDYDLTWDLDVQKQLEADYSERPVLVVDQVYPSAIPE